MDNDTKPAQAILEALKALVAAALLVGAVVAVWNHTRSVTVVTTTVDTVHYRSWDTNAATAHALEGLRQWVNLTTTTTPAPPSPTRTEAQFFECIRWRESRNNYEAIDQTGTYRGAYQFYQDGWDTFALQVAPQWVGTPPNEAPPAIQDAVAHAAYKQLGASPWNGACQ